MRYSLVCLLLGWALLLTAQSAYDFDFTNKSLREVVEQLSTQHNIKFSYNPKGLNQLRINNRISANSEAELISKVFQDLPYRIQLSDGVYLIIPTKSKEKSSALSGQIHDSQTGAPLAFAHIQTEDHQVISDQNGRFRLPPREKKLTLKISYLGYEEVEMDIDPLDDNLSLTLEQNPLVLQEIILNSTESSQIATRPSFFSMNAKRFNVLPMLGETDVFRSIQLLPGIQATNESASGIAVRGGTFSQNLIVLDGMTLYNLDHFFGVFSTINPNVVDNISIMKGGFGAQYGGRVSSVIDVTGRTGFTDSLRIGLGLNLLSFNGYVESPIGKKTSFLIGMRESLSSIVDSDNYRDFLTNNRKGFINSIDPEIETLELSPSIEFRDLNARINHRLNDHSVISANLYHSSDYYQADYEEEDELYEYSVIDNADWANNGLSLDWKNQFNDNWYGNVMVSLSAYEKHESLNVDLLFFDELILGEDSIEANSSIDQYTYEVSNSIGDFTLKSTHEIEIQNGDLLTVGLEYNSIETLYNTSESYSLDFSDDQIYTDTLDTEADILSLFGNYRFQKNGLFSNFGLRGTYYDPTGDWFLLPRLDVGFTINENLSIKGATSFHRQFVTQLSLAQLNNSEQLYFALSDDDYIPVQRSTHFIFGGNYTKNNWSIDLEFYKKTTHGILDDLQLIPLEIIEDPDIDEFDLSGTNESEGLDLFIKYRTDKFTSWISYSLARSNNQFWYRNNNNPYPSRQDQRHEINFSNIWKIGKWEISSLLLYGSGRPYTPANESFSEDDPDFYELYNLDQINSKRLSPYSRIDLAAKYSFEIKKTRLETGITLFNLLNTANIKSRRYTFNYDFDNDISADDEQDFVEVVALDTYLLGFTPNIFLNLKF
ncbi:MAG: TonB-dependent receptor plug domain-containing protein [Cyclobacteriaceae bacterium]